MLRGLLSSKWMAREEEDELDQRMYPSGGDQAIDGKENRVHVGIQLLQELAKAMSTVLLYPTCNGRVIEPCSNLEWKQTRTKIK